MFYDDLGAALDWLGKAFGFETRMSMPGPDGNLVHAEMEFADGVIVLSGPSSSAQPDSDDPELDRLSKLSLEELLGARFTSASLTDTDARYAPAAVTKITQKDIEGSGARTLNELLQIYVPGLQLVRHHFGASHIGTRGFISGLDNYFLTVNGHAINKRSEIGAITERDLMLLSDIQRIEVIRGPGSAIYGFGAESMVIAITTFDGNAFEGSEIRARVGLGTERYSREAKHGRTIGEDGAFFAVPRMPGSPNLDGMTRSRKACFLLSALNISQSITAPSISSDIIYLASLMKISISKSISAVLAVTAIWHPVSA